MSTRDRMKKRARELVKREEIELPELGERVRVRGMMLGERSRVMEQGYKSGEALPTKLFPLVIALCTEDIEGGEPMYNPNSAEDVAEINALPGPDADRIVTAALRLSGMDKAAEATAKNG